MEEQKYEELLPLVTGEAKKNLKIAYNQYKNGDMPKKNFQKALKVAEEFATGQRYYFGANGGFLNLINLVIKYMYRDN